MVGFFEVEGHGPDSVEVPCTGIPATDYANLTGAMRERHPGVPKDKIVRTGSSVELRNPEEDPGIIDLDSGITLRQLFDSTEKFPAGRSSLRIGRAFFSGAPYTVFLTYNRGAGRIGVQLQPRTKTETVVNFSNQINPGLPVVDLPKLIQDVLGSDGRSLELTTRKGVAA